VTRSRRKRPPPVPATAEEIWIRLPLAPPIVAALRKHADAFAELAAASTGTVGDLLALVQRCAAAAGELEGDARRVAGVVRRRRRRRRP
jgi:hypothetical protein